MEASHPKQENRDTPAAAAGGGGGLGALQQLIELEDRGLQAAAFFLAWGFCTVIYGTVLNRSANPEHLIAGFVLFILGVALALLTLGGGGRLAARAERFLRGFF
ncbi:uncharacterized protein LOC133927215 [Phragmites australis]|uniref:uncharacterized protein LOC133927215 n=1 Tax=Phragmites australis TaxID=29695 RepID=UPI002D79505C|nr:uncharacterized protein LOC133927215 [Phragmites australis]